MNMERDLHKTFIGVETPIGIEAFKDEKNIEKFKDFTKFMMMYGCAIKEVRTKFEVLNDDFSVVNKRNPIEMIKSRVKSPLSIINKLERRSLPMTMDSILENLNDVAGVRVICSFIDDIYMIADMFKNQDDVTVIEIKDYIKNPKPNGYRSYHMIVEVPVFFSSRKKNLRVEVQLRTIAMDFWASLEHKMKYKKDIEGAQFVEKELAECANIIALTDEKMQKIHNDLIKLSDRKEKTETYK